MFSLKKISTALFGKERDIYDRNIRKHIALISVLAWIGLGADGLSSSAYGPEAAFKALGSHTELAIFLAIATVVTVFIISLAYMQVIDLFPDGGGGYKVASTLLGPKMGLLSGSALIVDYVLTVAISVAGGVDAMFSTLPVSWQAHKVPVELFFLAGLMVLNLRGMKESIRLLAPIFLGFVVTHVIVIAYGILVHAEGLPYIVPNAVDDANGMAAELGWLAVVAIFLKAFSMGGGTYTGLEAISNNVQTMADPKVKTAKWTMFYVALSLSFMAGGIIVLFLLWNAQPVEGQTLNAVVFRLITEGWTIGGYNVSTPVVSVMMFLSAGLLFVAANTGFLAGPCVLANMAGDQWMPHFMRNLSIQLVTHKGIVFMALAAAGALLMTKGKVEILVVLYSINVFLTFSLSMLGLMKHWLQVRRKDKGEKWFGKLVTASIGFVVCFSILVVTTVEKFLEGGWMTLIVTSFVVYVGWRINRHYTRIRTKLEAAAEDFCIDIKKPGKDFHPPAVDYDGRTAALFVNENVATGLHTLLNIQRLFPGVFKNFVFIGIGEVDAQNFTEEESWHHLRRDHKRLLKKYTDYCHAHNMPAMYYIGYGTDVVQELGKLCDDVIQDFPNTTFFATKLVFQYNNPFAPILHNQTAYMMQRRMHLSGRNMIILPMKI
jgi:amino acid transporter